MRTLAPIFRVDSWIIHVRCIEPFTAIILVAAVFYISNEWTPSSYGTVLKSFGADGAGLVFSEPRDIRSDESRVLTPYIQIAVNNGFKRFNQTSVYKEDLRNFNGMPLADWAILFKPYFWPFFFAQPWYAFSFYHAFFIVLFFIGYYHLFQLFSFPRLSSAAASVALFFTSFVQFWWTTWGPILAGFPWLLIIFAARIGAVLKVLLLGYTTSAWLLSHFYPPLVISLAFVSLLTILGFLSRAWNRHNLLIAVTGMGVGFVIVGIYLIDTIPIMWATVYPGRRIIAGGGMPLPQWLAQLFPFFVIQTSGFKNLVNINVCEASTIGSYVLLLSLVFANHRSLASKLFNVYGPDNVRRQLLLLALGFFLTSAWQLLPIPAEVGKLFFWHKVPPRTMLFASGLLLFLIGMVLLQAGEVRLTWPRFAWATAIILAVWAISKRLLSDNLEQNVRDILVVLPLILVVLLRRHLQPEVQRGALIGCAAIANLIGFGDFNPIQQARPIFDRPQSHLAAYLNALQASHPHKWLVTSPSYGGTILNGWGFRSIEHTFLAPQLSFFRPFFPEIPDADFNSVFNRYGHVLLAPIDTPRVVGLDIIEAPVKKFGPVTLKVAVGKRFSSRLPVNGFIDAIIADSAKTDKFSVVGWAFFDARGPGAKLRIHTDLPVSAIEAVPRFRPDLTAAFADRDAIIRGFQIDFKLKQRVESEVIRDSLCIVSEDPNYGSFLLANPQSPSACSKRSERRPKAISEMGRAPRFAFQSGLHFSAV